MHMIDINGARDFLLAHNNYLILMHSSPDGDTIGSGHALCRALQLIGKNAGLLCADPIPERYSYMSDGIVQQSFEPETVVAVDVADTKLLGDLREQYADKVQLCIDHHGTNIHYAENILLDSGAGAACEIIYDVISALGVQIDNFIADALYTGISTDTGCFKYSNTTARTHRITANLMEMGANTAEINRVMFDTKSRGRIEVERIALQNIEFHYNNKCALVVISKEMQSMASEGELDGITSLPRQIEGVLIGITMRERDGGKYKISVRTHEPLNASKICAKLGGGGHDRAAGCEITADLDTARKHILAAALEELGDN